MYSNQTMPVNEAPTKAPSHSDRSRYFHSAAAIFLFVLMFIGFQQFYLHGKAFPGRPLTPPIRTVVISHGIAMTLWMVLFVVQPLLIAGRNRRFHMTLGRIGAVLAALMVILGLRVGIEAARVNPPDLKLWGLSPKQFMAIPVISILIFAGYVVAGVLTRRRPETHRAMMLLATLAVIAAATDRIEAVTALYRSTIFGSIFGPTFVTAVIGGAFLLIKWFLTRSWDRSYAIGYAVLVVLGVAMMHFAPTSAWDQIATFLLR